MLGNNGISQKFFHANFTAFCELHRITIKECASLIRNVFDDFDSFPVEHRVSPDLSFAHRYQPLQITLYKNFAMKLSMTEGVYFSAKYLTKYDSSMWVLEPNWHYRELIRSGLFLLWLRVQVRSFGGRTMTNWRTTLYERNFIFSFLFVHLQFASL